jgi:hypothetical protein
MSKRGKITMGLYVACFGLSILAASLVGTKLSQFMCLLFILLMMIALYPVYLRDRRDYENAARRLP